MTVNKTILLPLILFLSSCSLSSHKEAIVAGQLQHGNGEKLVLSELDIKTVIGVDSMEMDGEGSFHFNVKVPEPGFFLLRAPSGKVLVLLLKPGETVKLSGTFNEFPDHINLEGSTDNKLMDAFFRFTRHNEKVVDSLEMSMVENQDSSGFYEITQRADTILKNIWDRQRTYELEFIERHPASLVSLIVLYYAFGINTVLNPEQDFSSFEKVDSALNRSYPENKHTKYHRQRMEEFKRLQVKTVE